MSLSDAEYIYNITISLDPCLETYQPLCLNSMPVNEEDKDITERINQRTVMQLLLSSHIMDLCATMSDVCFTNLH